MQVFRSKTLRRNQTDPLSPRARKGTELFFGVGAFFVAVVLLAVPPAAGQTWKMYAEQIKREKAESRSAQNKSSATGQSFPEHPLPESFSTDSPLTQPPTQESAATKPIFSVSQGSPDKQDGRRGETEADVPATPLGGKEESQSAPPEPEKRVAIERRSDPSLISDASLYDVCQSAPGVLWAVGDRGAVWMSGDGGEKWLLVKVPTTANLRAVSFANSQNGLIVGGWLRPGTPNGSGIILRTEDGGRRWQVAETSGIPFLRDVHYGEEGIAEAWGDSSELYPSGRFLSNDGGQSWDTSIKTCRHPGWKRGHGPSEHFAGISDNGRPLRIEGGVCGTIPEYQDAVDLTDFAHGGDMFFFSGRAGAALRWQEGGRWERFLLPKEAEGFDFETVSLCGSRIDIAGNPGTKIFSSTDAGRSWTSTPTGTPLPIRKILFVDESNGCAVGDLGNIMVTHDGGRTWETKHEGGRRAAWLGIFENSELIPYPWIASLSLKEGWLGAADILTPTCDPSADLAEVSPKSRLSESFIAAGGSSLTYESGFSVPPPELKLPLGRMTAEWNLSPDETPELALRRHLVQLIRTWRPTLLVLSEKNDPPKFLPPVMPTLTYSEGSKNLIRQVAGYDSGKIDPIKLALMVEQNWNRSEEKLSTQSLLPPFSQMVRGAILAAAADAADPRQFPEQILHLGLPPWKVERIGVVSDKSAVLTMKANDYIPVSGESIEEAAERASRIAAIDKIPSSWCGFEFIPIEGIEPPVFSTPPTSPLSDLNIARGTEARRQQAFGPINEAVALPRIRERRHLLALVDHLTAGSTGQSEIFRGNIDKALRDVDDGTAAEALLRIGTNLTSAGDPDSASEYLERLLSKYPETDAARVGAGRLLRYYAGLERIRRKAVGRAAENRSGPITAEKTDPETGRVLPAIIDHASDAVRVGAFIRDYYPELYMSAEIRFPLAAAQRRVGEVHGALGYYFNRGALRTENDLTGLHASGESSLLNDSSEKSDRENPLPIGFCPKTDRIPYLDGTLEPEAWNSAEIFPFFGDDTFPETFVALMCDSEHLFVGITAKQTNPTATVPGGPRMGDADMSEFDRIEIALDPDRDFTGFYHFTFDCRGWVSESCQGDTLWNPQIYVANMTTEDGWVAEIAIPWKELSDTAPAAGNVWGIALRRILPGEGFSSWNGVGFLRLEEGFGYLRFR